MKNSRLGYYLAFMLYVVGVVGYVLFNYANEKSRLLQEIDTNLTRGAMAAKTILPPNFHKKQMKKDDINSSEDMLNILRLSEVAKIANLQYVYTCIKESNHVVFTASSATAQELAKNENISHYFDTYEDAKDGLKKSFGSKTAIFDEYTDKWGHFRSVFIPIITDDNRTFIACADIKIDSIKSQLERIWMYSVFEIIFYLVILLPLFLVYNYHNKNINNQLEQLVKKRTSELELLTENLNETIKNELEKRLEQEKILVQQSKMAMMGEMISMIAHQWRQPLNSLALTIQDVQITYELESIDKEYIREFVHNSMRTVKHMSETIDNFREFFKPVSKKEWYVLEIALQQTLYIIEPLLHVKGIRVNCKLDSEHVLFGYKNELEQVFMVIISNAKDAMVDNEITAPIIKINIEDVEDKKVLISIEDNGGGIPESVFERIFEPYFTTKDQGKGTGIGLYMAKEIVERHMDGRIYAENTVVGAKFNIILPLN